MSDTSLSTRAMDDSARGVDDAAGVRGVFWSQRTSSYERSQELELCVEWG